VRRQLTGLVAASMSLVLIAFLVPTLLLVQRDVEHHGLLEAMQRAQTVAASTATLTAGSLPTEPQDGLAISVFLPDGRILGVPAERTPSVSMAAGCNGATNQTVEGLEILVPVTGSQGCPTVVRVLATVDALHAGLTPLLLMVLSLSVALFLIGILLAARLGRGLLRSVDDLAGTADRLATGDLSARASTDGPTEIRKTAVELNRLAIRVDDLVAAERRRSADLTHRLRTPLTALRLDVDALKDRAATHRLVEDVDAVTAAVNEVIRASSQLVSDKGAVRADLAKIARQRTEFWSALAEDTTRKITVQIQPKPLPVRVGPAALEALMDALLANVFAHTQSGVDLAVTAHAVVDGAVLVVEDAGRGFAHVGMVERGRSGGASTGLGLDIVRRTAEESGGALSVGSSPLGGARVAVRFGAPS
jgi:signal transduction histidine kinase